MPRRPCSVPGLSRRRRVAGGITLQPARQQLPLHYYTGSPESSASRLRGHLRREIADQARPVPDERWTWRRRKRAAPVRLGASGQLGYAGQPDAGGAPCTPLHQGSAVIRRPGRIIHQGRERRWRHFAAGPVWVQAHLPGRGHSSSNPAAFSLLLISLGQPHQTSGCGAAPPGSRTREPRRTRRLPEMDPQMALAQSLVCRLLRPSRQSRGPDTRRHSPDPGSRRREMSPAHRPDLLDLFREGRKAGSDATAGRGLFTSRVRTGICFGYGGATRTAAV